MELEKDFYTYKDNFEGLDLADIEALRSTMEPDGHSRCKLLGPEGMICTRVAGHEGIHVAHATGESDPQEVVMVFKPDYETTEEDKKRREEVLMNVRMSRMFAELLGLRFN